MNTDKRTAVIVGILFIIATAFLFVGEAFYGPVVDSPDFLNAAYPGRNSAAAGMLIEFSCILSIALIPVVAFPALRKHSEPLAIAYIVFRLFEAVLFVLVDITKLSLIKVSELYRAAESSSAAAIANIGAVIQAWNQWAWVFYVFIFAIGALIFYALLFRSRLLPRWISVWGLISAVMISASAGMSMFEFPLPEAVFVLLVVPIAVQEMVMAFWLIIKGFNKEALAA